MMFKRTHSSSTPIIINACKELNHSHVFPKELRIVATNNEYTGINMKAIIKIGKSMFLFWMVVSTGVNGSK